MNNNWMQLIFVILVFGGGALQWVLRKLGEQAAQRKAQQGVARQRTEVLRTGRASTQSATSTAQAQPDVDLDSIAARRQRQLEELRRRQQAARRPTNTPPARGRGRGRARRAGGAGGGGAGRRRGGAAGAGGASGKQTTLHALEHATTRPQKAHSHSADTGSEVLSDKLARESRQEAAKKEAKRKVEHASSAHGLVPRTAKEWRRAIIASEILAKPLSERSAEQHTG